MALQMKNQLVKLGFKRKEDAKGIPSRTTFHKMPKMRNSTWLGNIQKHEAKRAGLHFDLRLNDPNTSRAYSWAIRNLPGPGEKALAVEQPTHTKEYMGWKGNIDKGYGAGKVSNVFYDRIEVLESSPDRVTFNMYGPGQRVQRYMIMRTSGKDWLLYNYTATSKDKLIPDYKPKYKELKIKELDMDSKEQVIAPKMDGAHTTVVLRPNKRIDAYSYRLSKKHPTRIDHSYRTDLYKVRSPKSLGTTVLRGEFYLPKQNGSVVGGLLNTNV